MFGLRIPNAERYAGGLPSLATVSIEDESAIGFVIENSTVVGGNGTDAVSGRHIGMKLMFFFTLA